jgi:hypothetical protein
MGKPAILDDHQDGDALHFLHAQIPLKSLPS